LHPKQSLPQKMLKNNVPVQIESFGKFLLLMGAS